MLQKRMYEFTKDESISQTTKEIAGKQILFDEGVFWIQKQRQMHSLHYVTPYQASFPPQIPAYFIDHHSEKGEKVLDPFCGRGTTLLEANLRGRIGVGVDVSPLAIQISKAKLKKVTLDHVEKRLDEIDFSKKYAEDYETFEEFYHPDTYSQLINMKKQLKDDTVDNFIKTVILGRLHGHSPGFFSALTFNVISISPKSMKKQNKKHNSGPEKRDIKPRILKKAKTVLKDPIPEKKESKVIRGKSTNLPLETNSMDMIVTSPPFLGVINYIDDNWLRFWFLGYNSNDLDELRKDLVQTNNLDEYKQFIDKSMNEMNRVLKPGKYCIIEVGDVSHRSKKLNLDELIVELSEFNNFEVEKILINHISSPKISKAFSENAKKKGTRTNRCVIMKKSI